MKQDMKESLHIRRDLLLTVKTFKDRKGNLSNKPILFLITLILLYI